MREPDLIEYDEKIRAPRVAPLLGPHEPGVQISLVFDCQDEDRKANNQIALGFDSALFWKNNN